MKKFIDAQLLIYLTIFYTLTVALDAARKVYWKMEDLTAYSQLSWYDLLVYNILLDWAVVIFFMIIAAHLTKKMFEKEMSWKMIISVHLFFSFFIGWFIIFVSALIAIFVKKDFDFNSFFINVSFDHFMMVIHDNFLIYFSMIGIVTAYYYIKKVKNIELQKSKLQSQLATTKLNILKSQLHPHFMFNTLNSISSMIEIDQEKSQNLIADFGDLFRLVLEFKEDSLIPLAKELSVLEKYIDIISVRFSDHLDIRKEIQTPNQSMYVPSMLIQPIIENAIKHAYSYDNTELEIDISVFIEGEYLCFKVENNGTILSASFDNLLTNGTGLKNIYERLITLYEDDFVFDLFNKKDLTGVTAFIKIPIITSIE
nr:histidine kinase [uncultured Psychroserpens sp.]